MLGSPTLSLPHHWRENGVKAGRGPGKEELRVLCRNGILYLALNEVRDPQGLGRKGFRMEHAFVNVQRIGKLYFIINMYWFLL